MHLAVATLLQRNPYPTGTINLNEHTKDIDLAVDSMAPLDCPRLNIKASQTFVVSFALTPHVR